MEHTTAPRRLPRTVAEMRAFLESGHDVARIEMFSDGVFAIAITLLALEIKLPELEHHAGDREILASLGGVWRILFSYVFSFILIGSQWGRHHAMFRLIRRHDRLLLVLNLFGLMLVTLVPIPTALYGNHITSTAAICIFYAFHALNGAVWLATWLYASGKHRLIDAELPPDAVRYVTLLHCFQPAAMAGGLLAVLALGPQSAAIGLVGGMLATRLAMVRLAKKSAAAA